MTKKFEYKVISSTTELTEHKLNLLGDKGWELVSVVFLEFVYTYYIKREKSVK